MDKGHLQEGKKVMESTVREAGFSVIREGRKLREMPEEELCERYEMLFGAPPGGHLTNLHITRRILWRLQEIRYGGLTPEAEKALEDLADVDAPANLRPKPEKKPERIAGTQIEKIWRGRRIQVTLREDGKVEFGGRVYRSLSAVAKEITGTHWNGKAFFGVK